MMDERSVCFPIPRRQTQAHVMMGARSSSIENFHSAADSFSPSTSSLFHALPIYVGSRTFTPVQSRNCYHSAEKLCTHRMIFPFSLAGWFLWENIYIGFFFHISLPRLSLLSRNTEVIYHFFNGCSVLSVSGAEIQETKRHGEAVEKMMD